MRKRQRPGTLRFQGGHRPPARRGAVCEPRRGSGSTAFLPPPRGAASGGVAGRGGAARAPPLPTAPAGAAGRGCGRGRRARAGLPGPGQTARQGEAVGVAEGVAGGRGAGLLGHGQPARPAGAAAAAAARALKVSPLPQQRPGRRRHVRHGGGRRAGRVPAALWL